MKLNAITWLAWTLGALGVALIERNPFSQILLLIIVLGTSAALGSPTRWWRVGMLLAIIPVLFDLVSSRFGAHVLFEAPIPLVGGPYTLEALIYGAVSGLAIVLTIAIFAILQAGADIHDLLPLVPRPFYRAGAVVALALALVPQTTATFHRIREARSLDAHERSWARAAGIVLPVLLTSLERSLQYAESLDARGFGSRARTRFRPLQWTVADSAVIAGALLALASVALAPAVGYNPYLDLLPPIPSFASVVGVLCLGMPLSITSMRPRVATRPA